MSHRQPWLAELNLRHSELCVIVAVISHWRCYGMPVLRSEVADLVLSQEDLGAQSRHALTHLIRRGYLAVTGHPPGSMEQYVMPTARAERLVASLTGNRRDRVALDRGLEATA